MPVNKKLLLVEDDMVTAAAEAAMLKKNGFDVVSASSGEKAIQLINTLNFDLILMDIDLGSGINGSETAEIILSTKMIPIVFLTSHSEKETVEKVRSITRYGYVIKNSGDFVLLSSIEMAFELFNACLKLEDTNSELTVLNEELNTANEELNAANEELTATNEQLIEYQKYLEISEEKFRQLFENMTEGAAIHELCYDNNGNAVDYRIISVNASFEKHTGISIDNVKGKLASELYGTGTPPYLQEYAEVTKTRRPVMFDTYFEAMNKHFHIGVISVGKSLFATIFEDVTGRIRNEQRIKESERKYRNLFHYGHAGLFETSLKDAKIKTCNQRYCDMAGINSVEEAIGQDILHLYADPEDREEIKRIMREQGYISDHIIKLKNQKTGKIFWAEFSARLNIEEDVAEGTIIDVTKLKNTEMELRSKNEELQAAMEELEAANEELTAANSQLIKNQEDLELSEANLRESQDIYKQLFESESDAIFLIENENGHIIEANSAATDLYGFSYNELKVMKNTDLSAEPEETQKITHGTPVISKNVVTIPLRYHRKKDGTVFPVEITGRFFQWHGKPVHIAAIRNITERINNQDALKKKNDELEIFFSVALDLFCIADTDGNFVRVNKSWEKILGYKSEEIEKKKFLDFIHPDDMENTMKAIQSLSENNPVLNFVNRYRCFDGSYRYLEWRSYPHEKLIYAAARDITERKQADNKIQSLLNEKEVLLREVHHRIKNNMYTVSNLLLLQSETLTDKSAVDALNDARNRVQSMMLIYDKLYRSSDYKNISIRDYLNSLIDEIASIFADSNKISVEKKIDDFVMNSNTLFNLGIIINEVITNSFKYAFPGNRKGTIKVSVIKIDEHNGEISIIDNGIGFLGLKSEGESAGFGFDLIKILAEQINAKMELSGDNGTYFKMVFSI